MLKPILLASAMIISAPALAQDMTTQSTTAPGVQSTAPATPGTAPTDPAASMTQDSTATQAADPATSAQAAPADSAGQPQQASAAQIAQIVETEFPNYDGDKDGEITQDEFGRWMVALRSASDPSTNAQSAEVQTWVGQAFASADMDKSTKVSKTELTSFLAQGAS
ncbi:EF-hand domain-containing protein [Sphingomonas sp. IW22]|uniref:EF-hand domain-containing protein n=1 Tax=Sphingomonas sp. IW22 TaxID=3242489 RepID=UPI003521179C